MDWFLWSLLGTMINDSSATPCQCLICGHNFYSDPDLMENAAETEEGIQSICPNCGAIGQVRLL